jgi:hypothetical protein
LISDVVQNKSREYPLEGRQYLRSVLIPTGRLLLDGSSWIVCWSTFDTTLSYAVCPHLLGRMPAALAIKPVPALRFCMYSNPGLESPLDFMSANGFSPSRSILQKRRPNE